jgi:hypothetical protein
MPKPFYEANKECNEAKTLKMSYLLMRIQRRKTYRLLRIPEEANLFMGEDFQNGNRRYMYLSRS